MFELYLIDISTLGFSLWFVEVTDNSLCWVWDGREGWISLAAGAETPHVSFAPQGKENPAHTWEKKSQMK